MKQLAIRAYQQFLLFPLKHNRVNAAGLILLRVITAFLPTAKMIILARFVDVALQELQNGAFTESSLGIAGMMIGILLLGKALEHLMSYLSIHFSTIVSAAHERRLIEKKSRVCFSVLENAEDYELMCRVMDDQSERIVSAFENLMALAECLLRILFVGLAVAGMNLWCGLFLLAVLLAILPVAKRCGGESYTAYEEATKYYKISRYLRRVLSERDYVGERTQYGYTPHVQEAWDKAQEQARLRMKQAHRKNIGMSKLLTTTIAVLAVLLYGGMLLPLSRGDLTAGDYVSVVTTTAQIISMLAWSFAILAEKFEENQRYAEDLVRFLDLPEEQAEAEAAEQRGNLVLPTVSQIEFRDVSFCYPGCEQPVLNHVSFRLDKGSSYALVGKNGAGKTTIIKLLTGFYTDYTGEILVDGKELRDMDAQTKQGLFSVIYQDFARYQLTVRENLTLGCPVPPEESAIWQLVDSLDLREKLDGLPEGLETNLGRLEEIGIDFSGGEWQKIAIARAVLKRAPILIMDEPTAALDPLHERAIFQLFAEHSKSASISILITHRLGGIRSVDHILVLEDGAVCEEGSHEALMRQQGLYAALYTEQERWYR